MNTIQLGQLRPNPNNPRVIRDDKLQQLCNNIAKYPRLISIRPIVVESRKNPVIIGGNMRYRALCELGYKEIPEAWVRYADELTPEERQAFIILDNQPFGEWDYEALANEWSADQLEEWGLEMPKLTIEDPPDELEDEQEAPGFKMYITFTREEDQLILYKYLTGKGYQCKIVNK